MPSDAASRASGEAVPNGVNTAVCMIRPTSTAAASATAKATPTGTVRPKKPLVSAQNR
jgi:hypothetical protein